jgi:hypothetical protein
MTSGLLGGRQSNKSIKHAGLSRTKQGFTRPLPALSNVLAVERPVAAFISAITSGQGHRVEP